MYCVIQKVENKKPNMGGVAKKLEVDTFSFSIGDSKPNIKYMYKGIGKFERPIKTAYRISVHKSYRKDGKVKKKQWVLCTIPYYSIIDWGTWIGDYIIGGLEKKLDEIGITEDELCNMVYEKLNPIIEAVEAEFKQTEEYKVKQEHEKILKTYGEAKTEFEKLYGKDTYDYCYDVFGNLRNEEYLNQLKAGWDNKRQYESSYYDNFKNNYDNYDFSGYFNSKSDTYTEDEKDKLKKFYRTLAAKYHPDICKDDGEMMKLVNKLKESWGI